KSRFIEMFGDPIRNVKGWKTGKMNDVAPVVNYKGDFNKCKVWLLNLDMVESNTGNIIGYNYVTTDEIGNSTCTFDTTNILYSKLRPYLNKVVIPNEIGYATSEMVPLQPVRGVLNRYYLAHMLRNKSFVDYISEKVSGAKMPRVTMNEFRSFEVPIPPIELQNQFEDFVKQVEKLKFEIETSLKSLEERLNSFNIKGI
ncbi:restriction endonuclease subunit S, partial [Asaccharospora irregularis]